MAILVWPCWNSPPPIKAFAQQN